MNERSIFLEAVEISDEAGRAAYLERACGGDPALRAQVDALLEAHRRTGDFMGQPATETAPAADPAELPGARVGPYKLLQQIGQGGMGVVYMAQQERPVRRTVALKIIRKGMDSKSILARFEAERQALAMMDHPNIARVLDVGTTEAGSPYFVMELVKGVPITRFCEDRKLGLRERLALFIPVCQAIQHAHQKGVIHRDIKPSNVLVALYDDHPVPKVIDFGVAKATGPKLTDKTLFTAFGAVVGTLEYMSPEQAKLNQLDIDTRSDVYALGVLLYELLTGATPLDRARLASAAFDEVLRLIREEEPVRPSTRLSAARTRPELDAARRVEQERLGHVIKGELDWIVMKALEKDRARRYETANGLARDVQRYLEDEPVEACPPTLGYRLRKVYRRNRAAAGAAAGFVLLLTASALLAAALAVQARRAEFRAAVERDRARANEIEAVDQRRAAERARRQAEDERRSAQAVRDFLQKDLLGQASDFNQAETRRLGGEDFEVSLDPTIGVLLDRAAVRLEPGRIDGRFPGMPYVQAEVLGTVGDAYIQTGRRRQQGLDLLRRAVDLHRDSGGFGTPAALRARQALASAHWVLGLREEALALVDPLIVDRTRVLGPHHPETVESQNLRGTLLLDLGRPAEALDYYRPLVESARVHLGPDHIQTLWISGNFAAALGAVGRLDEALEVTGAVVTRLRENKVPFDHPGVEAANRLLADLYKKAKRHDEAERVYLEALAGAEAAGGPTNLATWYYRAELAYFRIRAGDLDAAMDLYKANLLIENRGHRGSVTRAKLARCLVDRGRPDEALALYREALDVELARNSPGYRSWWTGKVRFEIGRTLLLLGKPAEAEPFLADGYRDLGDHPGQTPPWETKLLAEARTALIELYKATDRPEEARRLEGDRTRKLETELDRLRRDPKATAYDVLRAAGTLGNALVDAGRKDEVIPIFRDALGRIKAEGWPLGPEMLSAYGGLRLAVSRAGRHDLAAELAAGVVDRIRERPGTPPGVVNSEVFALASHLLWDGRADRAEPLLREALAAQDGTDPSTWQSAKMTFFLGTALQRQGKLDEAEPLLLRSFELAVDRIALAPSWEKHFPERAANLLAALYTTIDRPEQAEKWRAEEAKWTAWGK